MNNYRSGFVTLLGRPNVGKSTLINKLVGKKIAITSPTAQTTRNKFKGILTTQNSQIIFLDTPGIHKPHHLLGEKLVKNAKSAVNGVDLILLVFDSNHPPGKGDIYIKDFLISNKLEFIVVLNKWDLLKEEIKKQRLLEYRQILMRQFTSFEIVSSRTGEGCEQLINKIKKHLPVGPLLYPQETFFDQSLDIMLAELVREQVLLHTREEIPHSVAVKIEKIEKINKHIKNITAIFATIIVERKSQKGILIGKNGSMLKDIGKFSRINMKEVIDGPIYLELFVKVIPNWRKKESRLIEFGYSDDF